MSHPLSRRPLTPHTLYLHGNHYYTDPKPGNHCYTDPKPGNHYYTHTPIPGNYYYTPPIPIAGIGTITIISDINKGLLILLSNSVRTVMRM